MKIRSFLLIGTALAPFATTTALANDASFTAPTTTSTSVTISDGMGNQEYSETYSITDNTSNSTVATSLNTTGTSSTNVGNYSAGTTVGGSSVVVNGGSGGAEVTVGAGTITTDGTLLQRGTANINTTGTSATTLGASGNTTSLLSNSINVGTGSYATNVAVGSAQNGTNVNIAAGGAVNNQVALSAGGNEGVVVQASVSGSDENSTVKITASNISGDDEGADIDINAADSIAVVAGDDFDVEASDRTRFETSRFYVNVGATPSGNIGDAGVAVAGNGEERWTADENGRLVSVGSSDTTTGTTAAMVVTNPTNQNVHGLVVQETKTTLSGGTNSASMTLDDRGATFSNPADGSPIQVHGVADGTAPFDAVNVRQLYSGLASVLAASPEIRLQPGESGFGIGVGAYGGYSALGVGFGHMYDSGTVFTGSVAKSAYSELAVSASLSWSW